MHQLNCCECVELHRPFAPPTNLHFIVLLKIYEMFVFVFVLFFIRDAGWWYRLRYCRQTLDNKLVKIHIPRCCDWPLASWVIVLNNSTPSTPLHFPYSEDSDVLTYWRTDVLTSIVLFADNRFIIIIVIVLFPNNWFAVFAEKFDIFMLNCL